MDEAEIADWLEALCASKSRDVARDAAAMLAIFDGTRSVG
jgi:hypothetical protein